MHAFPRQRGFSLIELLLVLAVVAALAIGAFFVYPTVQTKMRVQNELAYINSVSAQIRGMYPLGNYQGLSAVWGNAVARQEPWTISPNGWQWNIVPATQSSFGPVECQSGRCTSFWFQHYYRDDNIISDKECMGVLMGLNMQYRVQFYEPRTLPPEAAVELCDRQGPAAPLFLSVSGR